MKFDFGFGKEMSQQFSFGAALTLLFGNSQNNNFLNFTGLTVGGIYKFSGMPKADGFGIYSPQIGISATGGIPIGKDSASNLNSISAEYNFGFYNHKDFMLSWYNEIMTYYSFDFTPVKIGFQFDLKNDFVFQAGSILYNQYDKTTFTAGAGYKFKVPDISGSVNYSTSYGKHSKFTHLLSATIYYGKPDTEAPVTSIKPSYTYISPNDDGVQDFTIFNVDVKDKSPIKGWQLLITDSKGKRIKEFKMSDREIMRPLTPSLFVERLISPKISLKVPGNIIWDGTDSTGKVVPDGTYTYSFTAWDEHDNIAPHLIGTIFVDNTPPAVNVLNYMDIFSPNGDGVKDEFIAVLDFETASEDDWKAEVVDSSGNIVKEFTWKGSNLPKKLVWDGNDNSGEEAPEGVYSIKISGWDRAGNKASTTIPNIALTRQYEDADIRIEKLYFSRLVDKEIKFYPSLSQTKGLTSYSIEILNENKKPVHTITGETLSPLVTWDGKLSNNKFIEDGTYYVRLSSVFNSGNTPTSFDKKLIVDSTPPDAKVTHSPSLFSPDGDGEDDLLYIYPYAYDKSEIKKWTLNIITLGGVTFKTFSGNGNPPKEIVWDGIGDNLDIVESATDYYIQLIVTDNAGNTTESKLDRLHVDILVIVTERGLKMRISNIQFKFDSAVLLKPSKPILDRVYEILQKYDKYDVVVEGHTDNIGTDHYNLTLSEKRAKAVYDYLVQKGVPPSKLKFMGMGETIPLYPNTNDENRRRNRRVEFSLIKRE
jgi:outer membrane protein OmpA-like peptidoglycan-associated protein/flagellar hook assembly protein FlgD